MTNNSQQVDDVMDNTTRPAGRRRMGAYRPQTQAASNGHTGAVASSIADQAASVTPAEASPAPTRKTRMGQPAAPTPTQHNNAASSATAPAGRRRMGATDAAEASPAPRRMGDAPAGRQRMGASQPTNGRQRMGATPAETTQSQAAKPETAPATRMAASSPAVQDPTPQPDSPASSENTRPRWVKPALIIGGLLVVALAVVLGARWLRTLEPIQEFIATYDGHASQPEVAPAGIPAWLGWQHFLNMFFIVLIIRTGLQVRHERKPAAYWTAKKNSFFSPPGAKPKKVSLSQWLHQSLDVLWVLNGLIFIVLLFVTDHWMRIVPTSWDIFPNMLSGAIQYASLDWPTENGWIHYNALQVMAYFVTVFIAAPLAIISGLRISTWWPDQNQRLNKIYPVEVARAIHFPVMLYFVVFTIIHVFLVFFTGALRNLNHMYTSRDVVDWWGLVIFLASLLVIAAAWFLTQPLFTRPVAAKMGQVTK